MYIIEIYYYLITFINSDRKTGWFMKEKCFQCDL